MSGRVDKSEWVNHFGSMTTTAVLKKWGNSIALRLPSAVVKAENLVAGSQVQIHISENGLKVSRMPGESRIVGLCTAITPENVHIQTEWGSPQGQEIW